MVHTCTEEIGRDSERRRRLIAAMSVEEG